MVFWMQNWVTVYRGKEAAALGFEGFTVVVYEWEGRKYAAEERGKYQQLGMLGPTPVQIPVGPNLYLQDSIVQHRESSPNIFLVRLLTR